MGPMVSEKKIFKVFPIISLWELHMGMAAILISNDHFQSPFNTRLHKKFEERPRCFRGEVIQRCEWTDRWGVITTAHPKPLAEVS